MNGVERFQRLGFSPENGRLRLPVPDSNLEGAMTVGDCRFLERTDWQLVEDSWADPALFLLTYGLAGGNLLGTDFDDEAVKGGDGWKRKMIHVRACRGVALLRKAWVTGWWERGGWT